MTHAHSDGYKVGQKGAWTGILSNILLFVLKFSAGIFGRSQAMIADAFHTASDTLTSVGVLIGFKIAQKPPDEHHPLGHGRAESIAAKIVSLVLLIVGVRIAYDSAKILITGEMAEPGLVALLAAVLSIIVKEITYRRVIKAGEEINSTSLKADAFHHRSDVLSSVAALIGIAGAMLGKTYLDPLAGVIVGGFIIKMGAENFHAAYDELMDAAPPEEFRRRLENIIIRVKGVKEIKKIMVRKTGIEFFVEAIIGVGAEKTVEEGHLVTMKIKKDIVEQIPNVKDIIVHVEPAGMETD
ncbi:MAG: cation diffusion facilitator family transporter [Candidatus Omnitrophica bacterium]|nr:cation diffusion facilitator family transporter [Candidatus Omnitrophota bacterium]